MCGGTEKDRGVAIMKITKLMDGQTRRWRKKVGEVELGRQRVCVSKRQSCCKSLGIRKELQW